MAKATSTLLVEAKADTGDATRGLTRLQGTVITLNQGLELLDKVIRGVGVVIRDTTGAALEQERVYVRLASSMSSAGLSYSEHSDRIAAFLAQQQELTRFGDDQTASAMANLANLVGALDPTMDELERLTELSQDVSQRTGRDLASAAQLVGRAFAGNVEPLAEVVPAYRSALRQINKLPDAAQRGAQGLAILRAEFGGAARDIAPLDLALARLSNGWGDVREAIGDYIVKSPQVAALTRVVADGVDALAAALSKGRDGTYGLQDALGDMVVFVGRAVLTLGAEAVRVVQVIRGTVAEAMAMMPGSDAARAARQQQASATGADVLYGADSASRRDIQRSLETAVALGQVNEQTADRLLRATTDPRFAGVQREQALSELVDVARGLEDASLQLGLSRGAALERSNATDQMFTSAIAQLDAMERSLRESQGLRGDPAADRERGSARPSIAATVEAAGGGSGGLSIANIASGALADALEAADAKATGLAMAFKAAESNAMLVDDQTKKIGQTIDKVADSGIARVNALKDAWYGLGDALRNEVAPGAASVLEGIAAAAGTAIAANDKFGASMAKAGLQSLGSLAVNLGSMMILAGAGATALPMLFGFGGPAAVAAGIGLVAVGAGLGVAAGAINTAKGGSKSPQLTDSGIGSALTGAEAARTPTVVYDFAGVTVVTQDARTMRMIAEGTRTESALGGVGDPLLMGA
jgi:hypothetical protein